MRCPVCSASGLEAGQLEPHLATMRCPGCGGHWIKSYQYWKWRDGQGADLPELPPLPVVERPTAITATERKARLCPDCRRIMTRYPVGHDTGITLDRCGNCGGMWLDANEWESLRARNLHDNVNEVFSEVWQLKVARADRAKAHEAMLRQLLGDDDYEKATAIRRWIDAHERRNEVLAIIVQD